MTEPRVIPVSTHVSSGVFRDVLRYGERTGQGLGDALDRLIVEGLVRVGMSDEIAPTAQEARSEAETEADIATVIEASPRLLALLERSGVRNLDELLSRILAGTLQEIDGIGPSTERQMVEALVQAGHMTVGVRDG